MARLRTRSTRDVPIDLLQEFRKDLEPEFNIEVEQAQVVLLADDPPTWNHLIADSSWWSSGLMAMAGLYVAELVKEAAKETWKNRTKAVAAIVGTTDKVKKFAEGIVRLKRRLPKRTSVVLALSVPNDYFGAKLSIVSDNTGALATEIALFVSHIPALNELIHSEGLDAGRASTGIFLELLDNGDLKVFWFDRISNERNFRFIPFSSRRAQ